MRPTLWSLLGAASLASFSAPAFAITATVPDRTSALTGEPFTFHVVPGDSTGPVQIRWNLGDGTRSEFVVGQTDFTHTYAAPGHYAVLVTLQDDVAFTSVSFIYTVHQPLTDSRPTGSTDLVYDQAAGRIYSVNQDNDSLSVVDAVAMTSLGEVALARGPVALAFNPAGKLWVLHREAHSISVIDTTSLTVEQEVELPYASQPMGLAFSPVGDAAYVTLMALGKVLKLDPASGAVLAEAPVGASARGVSVNHDGSDIYVTRFISADTHGEVVKLSPTLEVTARYQLLADETTNDTDQQGRGLPNYLFSVGLSPDGLRAWIPGKKDNIFRGLLRDEQPLNADNTARPLIALLDLTQGPEQVEQRIDLDDRNLPTQVEFTPLGDYAFVSVAGSALVEVRDAYTGGFVTALKEAGFAPRGLAITSDNKLFVNASLSRSLVVYDVADIVNSVDQTTRRLTEIPTVAEEKLEPQVLRGKQLFFNSADVRMSAQGYLSCATCHFDGDDDGRVWDFASIGEGLRNSVSLLGRRGMGQGNVNWSGNLDEIQDFDDNIRNLFGGKGFLSEEVLATGSLAEPLGDKRTGLSPELDALAAYVASLDEYHRSPFRNEDGSLSADGLAGRAIFKRLGCGFCHTAPDGTDSARGKLHDVGTIKPSSGNRAFQELLGIDTPTLNGVWETPPYLHDGSAATLRDVLTSANPDDRHGFTSVLSAQEVDQLVAYVQQLDGTADPDETETGGSGAGGMAAGGTAAGGTPGVAGSTMPTAGSGAKADGGCALSGVSGSNRPSVALWLLLSCGVWLRRRRSR